MWSAALVVFLIRTVSASAGGTFQTLHAQSLPHGDFIATDTQWGVQGGRHLYLEKVLNTT